MLLTLLEKAWLCLLSGLDSDTSKLGTLRMVAVRPRACLAAMLGLFFMLLTLPVLAGVRVLLGEASSGECLAETWYSGAVRERSARARDRRQREMEAGGRKARGAEASGDRLKS